MTQGSLPEYLALSSFVVPDSLSFEHGKDLIAQGKVGAIALAGGHGSRLGFNGPKGCFPISCVYKKSLYQLLAEKTLALSIERKKDLQLAIMTSDWTHAET